MKVTREGLKFDLLDVLFNESERGTPWVNADTALGRVTRRCGTSCSSEFAASAFTQLGDERFINSMDGPEGKKHIRINGRGLAAFNRMKAGGKASRDQLKFEFLDALLNEREVGTHYLSVDAILERVTGRCGESLSSELAASALGDLRVEELIDQVDAPDGKSSIRINGRGMVAYDQMTPGRMTGGDGLLGSTDSSSGFPMQQKKIFLSHASKDKSLAESLADLLTAGCAVNPNDILCTTLEGKGIPAGTSSFIEYLRQQIQKPNLVILLLSENFFASAFCLCELGAVWGMDLPNFPLVVPPLDKGDLKATLAATQAGDVTNPSYLDELRDVVQRTLGTSVPTPTWNVKRDAFLKSQVNCLTGV